MLIVIIYCVLVLFYMCWIVLSEFSYVSGHGHLLVVFFSQSKVAIFLLSHFFLTTSNSHGNLYLAFGLVGMHSPAAYVGSDEVFIFVIWSMYFKYLLNSIEFVSYSYRIFIINISIGKWRPFIEWSFDCILFLRGFRRFFALMILWSEDTPSKREYSQRYLSTSYLWIYNLAVL